MVSIQFQAIGLIHSPFKETRGTPIQPTAAKDVKGTIEIFPEYREGLRDISGFSHIFLIYHLHLVTVKSLVVKPFLDNATHGIFATRSPGRPNPIGISVVRLLNVQDNILNIQELDIVDGTPLLDIKPYVPEFDDRIPESIGWFAKKVDRLQAVKDDGRFSD
jgi:tRNA-Thr(GGU) m(6)t(6)A37 methyltransferase TsaA